MIPRKLKKYFRELPFYIEYDVDIEEIKSEAVLYIPIVAALTPIAWASGFELHAPTLDRNFLNSIKEVSKTFKRFYPKLHTDIQIDLLNVDRS